MGMVERRDPGACSPAGLLSSRFNVRPCLKKESGEGSRKTPDVDLWAAHVPMLVCTWPHTCTYARTTHLHTKTMESWGSMILQQEVLT